MRSRSIHHIRLRKLMPDDINERPDATEPSKEDWRRAALELTPPQNNNFLNMFLLWLFFNVIPAVVVALVLLVIWLWR